jgi:hypothetical protein
MTPPRGVSNSTGGRDILAVGPEGLERLPDATDLSGWAAPERHVVLEGLRGELYDVASVVADRTLRRARDLRGAFAPYGLVRSLFSQLRVVAADPRPFEQGSIDGFTGLGRAYVDTLVFHLERELAAMRGSDLRWVVERLEQLLALYRTGAGRSGQARVRDPFSFMYGGLHFGASVSVQTVEVMTRLLCGVEELPAGEKVAVMLRSSRVLYEVAAVNLEDIPEAYRQLSATPRGARATWFSAESFVVHAEEGRPHRIDLRPDLVLALPGVSGPAAAGPPRYETRGCPARTAASGGPGAIAYLWRWCSELGLATGLIGDA